MADLLTTQLEKAAPAATPPSSASVLLPSASIARSYRFDASPTLTLSLTSGYAPHWTRREGVRELVQNWYDGCNSNLHALNQRLAASRPPNTTTPAALYSLSISRTSTPSPAAADSGHVLYQASASHSSRPPLHLGSILHHAPSRTLTFHNNAVSLSRAILLLGHTSKRGGSGEAAGMVGSFGEGMKVGMLALLRDGCRCWMGTRNEVWQFGFYHDSKYGETLLGVWTNDGEAQQANGSAEEREQREEADSDEVRAEWLGLSEAQRQERCILRTMLDQRRPSDTTTVLAGLSADDWAAYQQDFLFLSSTAPSDIVPTPLGSILLSDAHRHALYVKGFLVAAFPSELVYGVDLREAKLDRDRKAVLQSSELHRLVGSIWAQAVSARPELMERYFELLLHHSSSAESKNAEFYLTTAVIENVASTFFALHGHDSQPVLNSSGEDAAFISSQLSRRPVLVPAALYDILTRSSRIQPVDSLISQHQAAAGSLHQVALSSLSPQQLHCLQSAVRLLQSLAPLFSMDDVAVSSFADDEGAWCKEEVEEGSAPGRSVGAGAGVGARAGKVLLDSRVFDIEKVHARWGDCGLEERRVQQGKGKGVVGLVAMSECSCREAAIVALILKETRRVRWKNGRAAAAVNDSGGSGGGRAGRRTGGDAIMEHIARGRESELLMVNLLERTLRRAEAERARRQALEETKQLSLQKHAAHNQPAHEEHKLSAVGADREEHGGETPGAVSVQNGEEEQAMSRSDESKQQRDVQLLRLQHELELLRSDLSRQQQLAAQVSSDAQAKERILRSLVAEVSGQSLDGRGVSLSDERLLELERLHVSALTELHRVREDRRRGAVGAEEERRKRGECGVCMSRPIDCVLLPCRHANACQDCARKLDKCGLCRKHIEDRIQYFV